jgi:hypothetical protein
MRRKEQPLKPQDFPVEANDKTIVKNDGKPLAEVCDGRPRKMSPSASTSMNTSANRIAGRPERGIRFYCDACCRSSATSFAVSFEPLAPNRAVT